MKIKKWVDYKDQDAVVEGERWSIVRLIALSADLPVMNVPLKHLNIDYAYTKASLRDMAMHLNAVNAADLTYPIILNADGAVLDGRHRIIKALMLKEKTIKAVRFEVDPAPDSIS